MKRDGDSDMIETFHTILNRPSSFEVTCTVLYKCEMINIKMLLCRYNNFHYHLKLSVCSLLFDIMSFVTISLTRLFAFYNTCVVSSSFSSSS